MTNKKLLIETLGNELVMSAGELEPYVSQTSVLGRLADQGEIFALGSGYYSTIKLDPFISSVLAVSKYFPNAVISNITALSIYELTDEAIHKIDVDIPRATSIRNKLVNAHRVPDHRLVGITEMHYHSHVIRIYDMERSLSDAYLRSKAGPLFYKALKRYLKLKDRKPNIDKLRFYDEKLGTKVVFHLAQELADE